MENNEEITDDDIASLQVIAYTDYDEPQLDVLVKARLLIERIAVASGRDINEKTAIIRLFDTVNVNMLGEDDVNEYEEETIMLLNPTDRYLLKRGKLELARKLVDEVFPIEDIVKSSGLSENEILNFK